MPLVADPEIAKTVEALRATLVKDNSSQGYQVSQGFQPYNLEHDARILVPIMSPIRNIMPREHEEGNALHYKAVVGINTTNVNIFAQEGVNGNQPSTLETDVTVPFVYMGLFDKVTMEADVLSRGFTNLRALASANLLRTFMQGEEQAILFGNTASAVAGSSSSGTGVNIGGKTGTCGAATLGTATAAGATLNGTYNVVVTYVTGMGESIGTTASQAVTTGNALTIAFPTAARDSGKPVLYYNVYIKISTDSTYQKIPQASNGQAIQLTSYVAGTATLVAADTTGSSLAFNGLFSQISGASAGLSGVNAGSYVKFLNNTLTLAALHTMLKSIWDNARGMPDRMYVNSTEGSTITDLVVPQGAAQPYLLVLNDQKDLVGDYRIGRMINRITGGEIIVDTHPFIPQGNILALSTKLPGWYPGSGITNVWKMAMPLDYTQIDYAPTGPNYPFEIRTIGALVLYLPSIQGWLGGITAS